MSFGILDLLSLNQGGFAGVVPYEPVEYPLSFPSSPSLRRVRITAAHAVATSRSPFSFKTQAQAYSNECWQAEAELPPMPREQAEEWAAFILLLNGEVGTFMLGDPLGKVPRGSPLGSPYVQTDGQTGRVLATAGWDPDVAGILLPGDYIQIGQRLYKNLRLVNSDSAGLAKLDIWPRLRDLPPSGTAVQTSNCRGVFRLASSSFDVWGADEAGIYSLSFSCIEAV